VAPLSYKQLSSNLDPSFPKQYWTGGYRADQGSSASTAAAAVAYMNEQDRHVSAAARQSVEGTSTSSYEPPTYSSPGGLRGYPGENYSSSGESKKNQPAHLNFSHVLQTILFPI